MIYGSEIMSVQLVIVGLLASLCGAIDLNYPKVNPCVLIRVESNNTLSWTPANESAIVVPVNFTEAKVINGSCDDTGPFLELFWAINNGTMRFDFKNTSGKVDVNMTVSFVPAVTFVDKNNTDKSTLPITVPMMAGIVDEAFKCTTEQVKFTNKMQGDDKYTLVFRFKQLMMQGFGVENSTFSKDVDECAADEPTTIVPITTEAPTTEAPTTKPQPTAQPTTAPAVPTKVTLKATDGNITCALLVGKITLLIPYNTTKAGEKKVASVIVPKNVISTGNCSACPNMVTMTATFYKGWKMLFQFGGDSHDMWWYMLNITVVYDSINFPDIDPSKTGKTVTFSTPYLKEFKVRRNGSYLCNSDTTTNLNCGLQIKTADLQYTALQANVSSFSHEHVTECSADKSHATMISIVLIAVGILLAALVVIAIVGYLIIHRRRMKAYETLE